MRALVIHQNFPGQFRHLLTAWSTRPDWQVLGVGRDTAPGMTGVRWLRYRAHRGVGHTQHPYLRSMEDAVLHGQAVARKLVALKRRGFIPDAVIAHPGWGDTLYLKDVYPDARLVHFCEWYYASSGSDIDFDPEFPSRFDDHARIRTRNALHLLNLENCDAGVSPTQWQRGRHPRAYQPRIAVAHEGIDTGNLGPEPDARLTLADGTTLCAGDPVITYVARNLEPYRGFHSFMRALATIQRRHPHCHALIVGGDGVSYGRPPADAANWRVRLTQETRPDPARTHFLGRIPYSAYRTVLQVSAAHVYLTYPFVLSWSMLEAMACGCLVIGSRTPPVEEVIHDGDNGMLVDFLDPGQIAERVLEALDDPVRLAGIRTRAIETARKDFRIADGIAAYDRVVQGLGNQP